MSNAPSTNEAFQHFLRMTKLEAVIDFLIANNQIATYKYVAKACGWHHRDQKFHTALGEISRGSFSALGAAKSVVVCAADNDKRPALPGNQLFELLVECGVHAPPDFPDSIKSRFKVWEGQLIKLGMDPTTIKRC